MTEGKDNCLSESNSQLFPFSKQITVATPEAAFELLDSSLELVLGVPPAFDSQHLSNFWVASPFKLNRFVISKSSFPYFLYLIC